MKVGNFELANEEKLDRAVNGTLVSGGKLVGGVGLEASDEQILAEYDRLGGLILKDGLKVKSGCFWNFEDKKAQESPEVLFEVSVDDALVEVSEDEAKALESARKKRDDLKSKAKSKSKGKKLRRLKKEVNE